MAAKPEQKPNPFDYAPWHWQGEHTTCDGVLGPVEIMNDVPEHGVVGSAACRKCSATAVMTKDSPAKCLKCGGDANSYTPCAHGRCSNCQSSCVKCTLSALNVMCGYCKRIGKYVSGHPPQRYLHCAHCSHLCPECTPQAPSSKNTAPAAPANAEPPRAAAPKETEQKPNSFGHPVWHWQAQNTTCTGVLGPFVNKCSVGEFGTVTQTAVCRKCNVTVATNFTPSTCASCKNPVNERTPCAHGLCSDENCYEKCNVCKSAVSRIARTCEYCKSSSKYVTCNLPAFHCPHCSYRCEFCTPRAPSSFFDAPVPAAPPQDPAPCPVCKTVFAPDDFKKCPVCYVVEKDVPFNGYPPVLILQKIAESHKKLDEAEKIKMEMSARISLWVKNLPQLYVVDVTHLMTRNLYVMDEDLAKNVSKYINEKNNISIIWYNKTHPDTFASSAWTSNRFLFDYDEKVIDALLEEYKKK